MSKKKKSKGGKSSKALSDLLDRVPPKDKKKKVVVPDLPRKHFYEKNWRKSEVEDEQWRLFRRYHGSNAQADTSMAFLYDDLNKALTTPGYERRNKSALATRIMNVLRLRGGREKEFEAGRGRYVVHDGESKEEPYSDYRAMRGNLQPLDDPSYYGHIPPERVTWGYGPSPWKPFVKPHEVYLPTGELRAKHNRNIISRRRQPHSSDNTREDVYRQRIGRFHFRGSNEPYNDTAVKEDKFEEPLMAYRWYGPDVLGKRDLISLEKDLEGDYAHHKTNYPMIEDAPPGYREEQARKRPRDYPQEYEESRPEKRRMQDYMSDFKDFQSRKGLDKSEKSFMPKKPRLIQDKFWTKNKNYELLNNPLEKRHGLLSWGVTDWRDLPPKPTVFSRIKSHFARTMYPSSADLPVVPKVYKRRKVHYASLAAKVGRHAVHALRERRYYTKKRY